MSDDGDFRASRCPNGHLTYPGHGRCPDCGEPQNDSVSLADRIGTVVTWTESTATPPGVRAPNTLAIVAFEIDGKTVQALGQTTAAVSIGQRVNPVFVEELRNPDESLRPRESQAWSGYRFEPVQ